MMGKTEKNQNENHATKVTKNHRRKYGMNETKDTVQPLFPPQI